MTRARFAGVRRGPRSRAGRLAAFVLWAAAGLLPDAVAAMPPQVQELVVRVGDRSVRALCTPGPREALLVQSEPAKPDVWRPVLERLDGVVGACAYERAPTASGSRGWFELMDEMRRTHEALGFDAGYTLAGTGLGGLYARLYAAGRRTDVAALVLVDPAHEDWAEEARHAMPPAAWNEWQRRRSRPNDDGVVELELVEPARRARLHGLHVTVITAGRRPGGAGWDARFFADAARRVHASILDGVVHGRHVPASFSGHEVHLDEPELVAREVVRAVRGSKGRKR